LILFFNAVVIMTVYIKIIQYTTLPVLYHILQVINGG
jgi:hypothetical protein